MRMSCNGCRVLRKGCSEGCTIRPCLQWIKTPEAQANATVFLAKFYGRAGLLNLLAAGPDHLRPAVFRSLLYEACGRIVNPIYGSVGLLWSGQWPACQAAVEAVLKGDPVVQVSSEAAAAAQATPPLRAYDIRHVAKDAEADAAANLLRVARGAGGGRTRFKRASSTSNPKADKRRAASPSSSTHDDTDAAVVVADHDDDHLHHPEMLSHHHEESAGSHDHDHDDDDHVVDDGDNNDMAVDDVPPPPARAGSEDTEVEAGSHVSQAEQSPLPAEHEEEQEEVGLELTLGFQPLVVRAASRRSASAEAEARCDLSGLSAESSRIGLRLELPA
uniref:LOB domain-containing protein n=1 Tax=Leersia perrieri TaxID=77586 RepID=A0A0D9V1H0_9ORYZ